MKSVAADLLFSATDLSNFLSCPHLTLLDRAVLAPQCRSPVQMRLANGFCRFRKRSGDPRLLHPPKP